MSDNDLDHHIEHIDEHTDDHTDLITSNTSNIPSCAYCSISNPKCLAKCEICNKWFCNGKSNSNSSNKGSHIITHAVLSKHNSISLHPDSDLGDSTLECYNCGNKNIFVLGFVSAKIENVIVILCRLPCSQQKDENWDTNQWQSLIEDRILLPWIVNIPNTSNINISIDQINKLESLWRLNKNSTLSDLENNSQNSNSIEDIKVDPILMRYTDAYQYQRSFAPLVKIESDYDKALKESKGLNYISIDWSKSLNNKNLASFYFSTIDSSELKVSIGDEMLLKYDGPEVDTPWVGKGYIIKLPDSRQETYTLEMDPYYFHEELDENGTESNNTRHNHHNKKLIEPPLHVNNRFTAEFVWKGISYERMQDAMKTFALDSTSISDYLYNKILGLEIINENDVKFNINLPNDLSIPNMPSLNDSQLFAVKNAIQSPFTLIQGPPGTGKTVTSATIIYHLNKLYPNEKILVCAPSNVAVDHLTEKLSNMGLNVTRLLAKSKEDIDSSILKNSLNEKIKLNANNVLSKLLKLKDSIGELNDKDSSTYFNQFKKLENKILKNSDIICCTCISAKDKRLDKFKFRSVLIDESTQSSEPESLIPIVKGCKQLILVGDHQQLGPVILNKNASDAGLRQSLFERMIILGNSPIRLEVQYRMHPCLSEFPSNMFYDGSLQNGITNEDRLILNSNFPWPINNLPMMFWAIYGREEISMSGTSYINRIEAINVEKILLKLFKDGIKPSQIGIITPYEGQRNYILQYIQMNSNLKDREKFLEIEIVSVDAFQGREKDYIILSCVRANSQQLIGFLRDPRRLNVALTRAKYGLMILGNPKVLNKDKLWNNLLKFYRSKGCLVEGQLDNLQLSSVQLSRINENNNSDNSNNNNKNSTSNNNGRKFNKSSVIESDTRSLISYEGSNFTNNSKWPSLNDCYDDRNDLIKDSNLEENIKKLTQQFGNDIVF